MAPWFLSYNARDYLEENPPADDIRPEVEQFLNDGVAIVKAGVPREFALEMKAYFDEIKQLNAELFEQAKNEDGALQRLGNMHRAFPRFLELFTRNRALAVQDYLFGAPTSLYTTLFFEQGSQQPFHRDTPLFCTRPEYTYCGMWVPMEDIDAENGPLKYFRGGHLLPEQNRQQIAKQRYPDLNDVPYNDGELWITYQDGVAAECRRLGLQEVEAHLGAGDTLIWHPQMPHGGAAHLDKTRTRCSMVFHTTPYGMPVYHMTEFFNPRRNVPATPEWGFIPMDDVPEGAGRFFADQGTRVDLAHKALVEIETFKQPAARSPEPSYLISKPIGLNL